MLVGAGLLGTRRAQPAPVQAEAILAPLLTSVYYAFDFREEGRVYDTLAHSIEGDLLNQVYLETRKGLELASQGTDATVLEEQRIL